MAKVRYNGGGGTPVTTLPASSITYDNTTSRLTADDVQEAIDEIEGQISCLSYDASDISYDNTTSGLTADDVQEALDEIDGNVDTLSGKVYKTDDSTETTIASDDLLPIYDTSATAAKKITVANVVKATISNPNLLDNPWFTVNQRGQNSYSGAVYSVDRWKVPHVDMMLTVGTNGIVLSNSSANDYFNFMSIYENGFLSPSTTYTMSVMLADGTIKSGQITTPSTLPPSATVDLRAFNDWDNGYAIGFVIETSGACILYMPIEPGATTPTIRAIKLEKGPISTLAMDTAPNYATELLKCQRYFQRFQWNRGAIVIATGMTQKNSLGVGYINTVFQLYCPMRTTPTFTAFGDWTNSNIVVNNTFYKVSSLSGQMLNYYLGNNQICVQAQGTNASSIAINYAGILQLNPVSQGDLLGFDVSADL